MILKNIDDVKNVMKKVADSIDIENSLSEDFKWFSSVNYTTTTEYYGELKIFLSNVVSQNKIPKHQKELIDLLDILELTLK